MLNLKEIADRISNPTLCSPQDIEDLKKLCETYPYAQVFPILYLNALSRSNDVRFDDELQKHAFRISDRTMLYNLLNQTNYSAIKSELEKVVDEEEIAATNHDETGITVETKEEIEFIPDEIEPVVENITTPTLEEESKLVEPENRVEAVPEVIDEIVDKTQVEMHEAEHGPSTEEIIETPIIEAEFTREHHEEVLFDLDLGGDIEDEEQTEIQPSTPLDVSIETLVVEGFNSIPIDEVFKKLEEEQAEKKEIFDRDLTAQTIAAAYSIEEEEKQIAKLNPKTSEEVASKTLSEQKNKSTIGDKKSFSSWLHANKNYSDTVDERVDIDALISRFIEEAPKISPLDEKLFESRTEKTEFYSPLRKAKESLDEHNLPVSETLAKVFASQGNFPKAIYAYQQLMLIIPEKKIFFANQIKELEKKLNK